MDYYSRWLEIIEIQHKDTGTIISKFTKFGISKEIIIDNIPFGSEEFSKFAKKWEIDVTTSSPHYPQSNGSAKKGVGIAKKMLQTCRDNDQVIELYLLNYSNAKVANLDFTLAQLLFKCQVK